MKTGKKTAAALLAAVMAATACFTGCSEATSSGTDTFEPALDTSAEATVNIIGTLENFEALEAVITDFNEYYPNVEVLYSYLGNYKENIEARLQSDTSVGIFITSTSLSDLDYVMDSCADLQECIDLSDIRDEAIESATVDGKVYNLPMALNTSGIAVNVSLLEEYGLETPTNLEEFLNCCKVLKENGYTPVQGYSTYLSVSGLINSMVFCAIAQSETADSDVVNAMINAEDGCNEIVREAYALVEELCSDGYFDLEVNGTFEDSYNGVLMSFLDGDIPFMLMSSETFSGMKKRETRSEAFTADPFEYLFMCTPFGEDDGYSYIENWSGLSINNNCPDKEWATEFLRFLATEDEMNELASVKNIPSAAKESDDERFEKIYTKNSENTAYNMAFVPVTVQEAIVEGALTIARDGYTVEEGMDYMLEYLRNPSEDEAAA